MSILIKGMEMPTSCVDCRFHKSIYCTLTDICTNTAQGCPLVPVPPHGRLIDADAFESIKYELPDGQKAFNRGFHSGVQYVQRLIMDAPTIIPASEEGET